MFNRLVSVSVQHLPTLEGAKELNLEILRANNFKPNNYRRILATLQLTFFSKMRLREKRTISYPTDLPGDGKKYSDEKQVE